MFQNLVAAAQDDAMNDLLEGVPQLNDRMGQNREKLLSISANRGLLQLLKKKVA